MKQKDLNNWLWKWHIIGGLISLPFLFLLSITGVIYLFKDHFNDAYYQSIKHIKEPRQAVVQPYSTQLKAVQQWSPEKRISKIILPEKPNEATRFLLQRQGSKRSDETAYVNPYTAQVTGSIKQQKTLMYKVRKLHGELLLGKIGTYTVELVASWSIVLILTGIYVWWPAKRFSFSHFFLVRTQHGRRILWRDMHRVLSFWVSIFLLIILAGGMPWTDVFGSQLKWVQAKTNTGYPKYWRSAKGLTSPQNNSAEKTSQQSLSVDNMVALAKAQNMLGQLAIELPKNQAGVVTVFNRTFWLEQQKVRHFNQYTGELIKAYDWKHVGILMELRQIAMRFHQGEYGMINWVVVLLVSVLFSFSIVAGLLSYLLRKPKRKWAMPNVPLQFKVGKFIWVCIVGLSLLFPLFGLSLLLISTIYFLRQRRYTSVM